MTNKRCKHKGLWIHDSEGRSIILALEDSSDSPAAIMMNMWCCKCGALRDDDNKWHKPGDKSIKV